MPEGPELRRSADVLRRYRLWLVSGALPAGGRYAEAPPAGYVEWNAAQAEAQHTLIDVNVKGKLMWWTLAPLERSSPDDRWHMLCTYGMTGGWTTASGSSHPAFFFVLTMLGHEMRVLTFDDQRHFGTIKFVRGDDALRKKLATLGPDMLADPPDALGFAQRLLRRPQKTLAECLMDQSTVSGVGNYVKAESLWRARLSPHRTVLSLSTDEHVALRDAVAGVMADSYALGGATIQTYRDPDGNAGHATSRFACYGRRVDADGEPVVPEETKDGRTTWWVPTRQR